MFGLNNNMSLGITTVQNLQLQYRLDEIRLKFSAYTGPCINTLKGNVLAWNGTFQVRY